MNLRNLLNKHGSDKAVKHHYDKVYEKIAGSLLEVGVLNGASLRAWREWLPESMIVGIDIFERTSIEEVRARIPDDVVLIKADSTKDIPELENLQFDNIIDDGCHYPEAQIATLENLWTHLASGGHYFIEDVWNPDSLNHPWALQHRDRFNRQACEFLAQSILRYADEGVKIHYHNFCDVTKEPDSFIIELVKGDTPGNV